MADNCHGRLHKPQENRPMRMVTEEAALRQEVIDAEGRVRGQVLGLVAGDTEDTHEAGDFLDGLIECGLNVDPLEALFITGRSLRGTISPALSGDIPYPPHQPPIHKPHRICLRPFGPSDKECKMIEMRGLKLSIAGIIRPHRLLPGPPRPYLSTALY